MCPECVHDCKDSFWVYKLECCCRWWFNYYFLYVQRCTCVDVNCSVVQSLLSIFGILIHPSFIFISFVIKSEANKLSWSSFRLFGSIYNLENSHSEIESDCATSNGPPFNILYTPSWYPSAEVFSISYKCMKPFLSILVLPLFFIQYKHAVRYTSKLTLLSYHFILIQLMWGS